MQKLNTQAHKLSPDKLELLDQLLRKKGIAVRPAQTVRPTETREFYPLSFAQERLWFIEQLEPGTPRYNIPSVTRLRHSVSVPILQRAFNQIIARHEVLRTTFSLVAGQPVQRIAQRFDLSLRVIDLRSLPAETREVEVQLLIDDEVQRPFNLEQGPLLRVQLLQLAETEHVLLVTMHHIISDGWSIEIFFDELTKLYAAELKGEKARLAELSVQYANYAVWQREWLNGEVLEEELSYWREQLRGAPSVLELPTDRPRPAVQSYRGAVESFALSTELTQALKRLSRETGATLFMTLLASFQLLLWRYTGQEDVVVGTPVANRTRAEIEGLIGFFVNTLVLRVRMEREWSFRQLLARVKEVCVGAYAHQEVPFERVVEELQPQRSLSHSPLFQVMFVLQNQTVDEGKSRNDARPNRSRAAAAKFDLTLAFTETGKQLHGTIEYKKDLFTAETIRRMLRHFRKVLEEAVKNPEQAISALPLLHHVEREQILREWNATRIHYPSASCVHELFEMQAASTPATMAVIYQNERLSYAELNTRANRLAHYLISLGVGPEGVVGICMERCVEMVVSLLAILKAGGAYVPLDPAYPQERLSFMMEDAGVRVLLTQTELLARIPAGTANVLCLDSLHEELERRSGTNPTAGVKAQNLAYVIYTSGSTGAPKGAMNIHGGLCNRLLWMQQAFGLTSWDRVLQKTPYSFDVSVWEFFWPLMVGATLVVAKPGGHQDSRYLAELIKAEEITTIHFVPSMLQVFLEERGVAQCRSLKRVICSGEALGHELQKRFFAVLGSTELHNLYGPTEASIDVTSWECRPESELSVVPIGRPIANTEIYIVDEQMQPVPVGIRGELLIGGVGLARGYLGRAELTAERFVPDGLSGKAGARLYRTGDVARYLADGAIEYVGRSDNQVKVRGYRIELGEIEAALSTHAAVKECVVMARVEGRLVGYVVPETQVSAKELRSFLKERLPEYMVPALFVMLDQLPLTSNGKVDRRTLPAPHETNTEEGRYVAARDIIELKLTQIWQEVLRVKPIGVRDNFFDLGGHSLLAVRLMALIQERLSVTLPLQVLFRNGTVEELAKLLREQSHGEEPTSIVEIQANGQSRPFFCVHPMGGNVFCYLELARHLGPDQPFYGIQPAAFKGAQIPELSLEEIASFYVEKVRSVQPSGPYVLGGWSFGGVIAFEMAQQLRGAGQEVSLLALLEASALLVRDRSVFKAQADLNSTWNLARLIWRIEGRETPFTEEDLQQVRPDERLNYILERAKTDRVLGVDFELAYLVDWAQGIKNSFKALADYQPRFYPGNVAVFEAEERLNDEDDSRVGWDELAREVDVHVVPGNHFTIVLEPHVRTLAQHLSACIRAHTVH